MRIGIVNDSVIAIESLRRIVTENNLHEVVWIAKNGAEGVMHSNIDPPDLILMDIMMPVMDGIEATRRIMQNKPCAILIVTASVTGNSSKVFEAMGVGALDAVATPVLGRHNTHEAGTELLRKIDVIGRLIGVEKKSQQKPAPLVKKAPRRENCLVAIGCSTGGPQALIEVLQWLPQETQASFAIIQHMDRKFTSGLASWLNTQLKLKVQVIQQGDRPQKGRILLPMTDNHLVLNVQGQFSYTKNPEDNFYHPSVDVFFDSIAKFWRGSIIGILLTGMGRDGAQGLLTLKERGHLTLAQDKESCIVYGMPKAAKMLNAANEILPLKEIGPRLLEVLKQKKLVNVS